MQPAVAWTDCSTRRLAVPGPVADRSRVSPPSCSGPTTCRSWPWSTCSGSSPGWAPPRPVENDRRLRTAGRRSRTNIARPRLVWPDLVYIELISMVVLTVVLVVWSLVLRGAAGAAGQSGGHAQPVEGPLVLPRPAGDARLLRSVDGRRDPAGADHLRPGGDSVSRLQPAGQRLLHDRPAASSATSFSCSASCSCGSC